MISCRSSSAKYMLDPCSRNTSYVMSVNRREKELADTRLGRHLLKYRSSITRPGEVLIQTGTSRVDTYAPIWHAVFLVLSPFYCAGSHWLAVSQSRVAARGAAGHAVRQGTRGGREGAKEAQAVCHRAHVDHTRSTRCLS